MKASRVAKALRALSAFYKAGLGVWGSWGVQDFRVLDFTVGFRVQDRGF